MATNEDSFPITAAMLTYAWVKPATVYTAVAGKATITDIYLPATLAEWAGARGTGTAVTTDPNYVFARTMKVNLERTPYVTGLPNDITSSDIVAPVEVTPTLIIPAAI